MDNQMLRISGMTCAACRDKIERKLLNTPGVQSAKVSYSAGTAEICYDSGVITPKVIVAVIEKQGYGALPETGNVRTDAGRAAVIVVTVVSLYALLEKFRILNYLVPGQTAGAGMGFGMLFVIGLITSVHCIAMCGGINLSQCIPPGHKAGKRGAFAPAALYNLGRVISYTAIGFILGFVSLLLGGGSNAGLPVMAQGLLKLLAGAFMVIMGINSLGIFPFLRKLQPRMPKLPGQKTGKGPLVVGLLNGLMPCGPLQSMQLVALAAGNPFTGALSMLMFSLGTVPLMLGLGSVVSALGRKFTNAVMTAGPVLVVVMGLAMLSQGGSLSGLLSSGFLLAAVVMLACVGLVSVIPFKNPNGRTVSMIAAFGVMLALLARWGSWGAAPAAAGDVQITDGVQVVRSELSAGRYPDITVAEGIPVKWIIEAPPGSINGCNGRLNIREYGIINYAFNKGENVIEFTPDKTGRFQYSCWMGMIHGSITVAAAETEDGP